MGGMGPAPSPNARRRNARPPAIRLPAGGRRGEPPEWPLPRPTKAERALWVELWASPQSAAWETLGWLRTVARYCRLAVQAERRGALGVILVEVRQLEDRLGLNPMAMRRLGWEVVELAAQEDTAGADDNVADLDRYRDRLSG